MAPSRCGMEICFGTPRDMGFHGKRSSTGSNIPCGWTEVNLLGEKALISPITVHELRNKASTSPWSGHSTRLLGKPTYCGSMSVECFETWFQTACLREQNEISRLRAKVMDQPCGHQHEVV